MSMVNIESVQESILHNIEGLVYLNRMLKSFANNPAELSAQELVDAFSVTETNLSILNAKVKESIGNMVKLAGAEQEDVDVAVEPAEDGNGLRVL